ncbi:hypothetical protein MINTM005_13840 [Mycobacterium intracellulare]|uniref:hypothetical protein n=1 Tax=Mycobacterium intracellulare TaxID=1767 RepID=UPI00192586F5|nr:hypothetical protein [Mycobacterium intracellulare]BCO56140.1 hypothetical protein MINTM005_13840 [Mycobacterium intracellulare]
MSYLPEPWWRAVPAGSVNGVEQWRIHSTTAASDPKAADGQPTTSFTYVATALLGAMVGSSITLMLLTRKGFTYARATR